MTSDNPTKIKDSLSAKGVKYCLGAYPDIHGLPKGKIVPLSHFEQFAAGSELYTGYALDGLGQKPNDDEIASVPDLTRGMPVPWNPEVYWFPADNTFHGRPYPVSTRVALKQQLAAAAEMGFAFNLGIECEVYFVRVGEDGSLHVPRGDDNLLKPCYDSKRFFDAFPLVDEIASAIDSLGWDLYSFDPEDGNGQFEFDFGYSDALTMCDRYVFFRTMAKQLAAKHGLLATFMPKPYADKTGNGAHFNMSLADAENGKNLFANPAKDDPFALGISELGYHYIAGVLQHGRALCAAFAPTVNSYKRLVRRGLMGYYSWAPVFNSFGTNNRTNSLRVPMAGGRVESRNADSSCNPYLASALVLAAGLDGIRQKLDPGQPQADNLYALSDPELAERGIQPLPRSLGEAIDAFASDPFVESTLGADLRSEFLAVKSAEWEEYSLQITPWEVANYASRF